MSEFLKNHYDRLKSVFLRVAESKPFDLNDLIEIFRNNINSNRRASCIQSLSELVAVLEKRDCLNPWDISPLKEIARKFGDSELNLLITRHEQAAQREPRMIFNQYQPSNIQQVTFNETAAFQHENASSSRRPPTVTYYNPISHGHIPEQVADLIATEIGSKWKDLARKLGIREGEIDEITEKYPRSVKERSYECLKMYQSKAAPEKLLIKLLEALTKARREDLRKDVQNLLAQRNLK